MAVLSVCDTSCTGNSRGIVVGLQLVILNSYSRCRAKVARDGFNKASRRFWSHLKQKIKNKKKERGTLFLSGLQIILLFAYDLLLSNF